MLEESLPGNPDEIVVDEALLRRLPATSETENSILEDELVKSKGPKHPLVIWRQTGKLVDGHRRLSICLKHKLPFRVVYMDFDTENDVAIWMIRFQLCRRNIHNDATRTRLVSELYERQKGQFKDRKIDLADRVADEIGVNRRTIYRYLDQRKYYDRLTIEWQVLAARYNFEGTLVQKLSERRKTRQTELYQRLVVDKPSSDLKERLREELGMRSPGRIPQTVLKSGLLSGIDLAEMDDPERCEGRANTRTIRERADEIRETLKTLRSQITEFTSENWLDSPTLRNKMLVAAKAILTGTNFIEKSMLDRVLNKKRRYRKSGNDRRQQKAGHRTDDSRSSIGEVREGQDTGVDTSDGIRSGDREGDGGHS